MLNVKMGYTVLPIELSYLYAFSFFLGLAQHASIKINASFHKKWHIP